MNNLAEKYDGIMLVDPSDMPLVSNEIINNNAEMVGRYMRQYLPTTYEHYFQRVTGYRKTLHGDHTNVDQSVGLWLMENKRTAFNTFLGAARDLQDAE